MAFDSPLPIGQSCWPAVAVRGGKEHHFQDWSWINSVFWEIVFLFLPSFILSYSLSRKWLAGDLFFHRIVQNGKCFRDQNISLSCVDRQNARELESEILLIQFFQEYSNVQWHRMPDYRVNGSPLNMWTMNLSLINICDEIGTDSTMRLPMLWKLKDDLYQSGKNK